MPTGIYKHRHCSTETKLKISLAHKGKKLSKKHKRKLSLAKKGKKLSDETKRKMSLAHMGKINKKHGLCYSRFYRIWGGIKNRCLNKNTISYKNYGGRGIKCSWKSFENFRDDMYKSYLAHVKKFGEKQTSIDRIDNNGNYCKENCRWVTQREQNNNKTNVIKYNNENATEASKRLGGNRNLVSNRLQRKWSKKNAFTKKLGFYQRNYNAINDLRNTIRIFYVKKR